MYDGLAWQWFYFRAAGAFKGTKAHFSIVNAGGAPVTVLVG